MSVIDGHVGTIVTVIIVVIMVLGFYARAHRDSQRDPKRFFDKKQRSQAIERCGGRCEHSKMFWRCHAYPEHMDHIYPWSKGGATSMGNLQALCAKHNLRKSDKVPSRWYIFRLERRRLKYFPPDEPVKVVWKLGSVPPPRK